MSTSSTTISNAMWCDKNKVAGLLSETVALMGLAAKQSGKHKKHNAEVDGWIEKTQVKVGQTITHEFAKNIGVLAKYIRSEKSGGYIDFENDDLLALKKVLLDPKATDVKRPGDIQAITGIVYKYQKEAEKKASPNTAKPNDVMAVAIADLTIGRELEAYSSKYLSYISEINREKIKPNSKNDRKVKRYDFTTLLIENMMQTLAFASTPLVLFKGDERHYRTSDGETKLVSGADIQVASMITGITQAVKEIARTKKDPDPLQPKVAEVERLGGVYSAEFQLKLRDAKIGELEVDLHSSAESEGRLKIEKSKLDEKVEHLTEEVKRASDAKEHLQETLVGVTREKQDAVDNASRLQKTIGELGSQIEEKVQQVRLAEEKFQREQEAKEMVGSELVLAQEQLRGVKKDLAQLQESKKALEQEKDFAVKKASSLEERVGQLGDELKQKSQRIDTLEKDLESVQEEKLVIATKLDLAESRVVWLEQEKVGLEEQLDGALKENAQLQKEVKAQRSASSTVLARSQLSQSQRPESGNDKEVERFRQENILMARQLVEKGEEIKQLRRELQLARAQLDTKPTSTMVGTPEVDSPSKEQVESFITNLKQNHEQVSSKRKNFFGHFFHSAMHKTKRDAFFEKLDNIKKSDVDGPTKQRQTTDAIKSYMEELAEGKSQRYLSNLVENLTGKAPDKDQLAILWETAQNHNSILDDYEQIIAQKMKEEPPVLSDVAQMR
jgi:hypothetical protein